MKMRRGCELNAKHPNMSIKAPASTKSLHDAQLSVTSRHFIDLYFRVTLGGKKDTEIASL